MDKVNPNAFQHNPLDGTEIDEEAEVGGARVHVDSGEQRSRASSSSSAGTTSSFEFDVYSEADGAGGTGSGFVIVDKHNTGNYYDASRGSDSEYESANSHMSGTESGSESDFVMINGPDDGNASDVEAPPPPPENALQSKHHRH